MSGLLDCSGVLTLTLVADAMKHSHGDLIWEQPVRWSPAERGDLQYDFIEITEDEANQIVARIRAEVTGTSNA